MIAMGDKLARRYWSFRGLGLVFIHIKRDIYSKAKLKRPYIEYRLASQCETDGERARKKGEMKKIK